MSQVTLDTFGALLMKEVRDRAIVRWDQIVDGRRSSESAQRAQQLLAALDPQHVDVVKRLIPEFVDTTIYYMLWAVEQELFTLSLTEAEGTIRDVRELTQGDLQGYLDDWIQHFSKQRYNTTDD